MQEGENLLHLQQSNRGLQILCQNTVDCYLEISIIHPMIFLP